MSDNKDCYAFRFSIVRILISVSNVTSVWDCLCHCLCHCLCPCHFHCLFVCQAMSPHHSDQMSQRSQVFRVALWRCSLNAFVFVFVFVFVMIFFLVRSCLIITLITCLKGYKSLGSLFEGVLYFKSTKGWVKRPSMFQSSLFTSGRQNGSEYPEQGL